MLEAGSCNELQSPVPCSTFAPGFHTMCSQWVSLSQALCITLATCSPCTWKYVPLVDLLNGLCLPPTPNILYLGCSYNLHSSHHFLSTWGAVILDKKGSFFIGQDWPVASSRDIKISFIHSFHTL